MSIVICSSGSNNRRQLPANSDRANSDLPLRDNPFNTSQNTSSDSTPEDESLIGMYPYSGADIKLVVHLPPEDPRATHRTEEEIDQELQQAIQDRDRAASANDLVAQNEATLIELRASEASELVLAEESPEGSEARTEHEAEVAIIRQEIAEITTSIQEARSGVGSIDELDQRIADLGSQLQSVRDGIAIPPTTRTKVLAEIQTLSISSHREKYPVRTLGAVYLRSVTRGPRTVSGSMVFTTFHNHIMHEFLESAQYRSTGVGDWDRFGYSSYLMDQIPPLDISISFANEYGNLSWMAILGVEFINEGFVMSIEDLFLEGTTQYIARDFDPIRSVANRRLSRTHGVGQYVSGTHLMVEHFRRRVANRQNPWI